MSRYDQLLDELRKAPKRWLVTGVAGFIGSNILQRLLTLEQDVVGLDNFSTGKSVNLDEVRSLVTAEQWHRFQLVEGDIREEGVCATACAGTQYVLHQAALGSVPASIVNPTGSHQSNVSGFLNVLIAARDAQVKRVVYASSSAVYGDDARLPKTEESIGAPLSPYAATKLLDEIYAGVFARCYGLESIGLRYFNVFGPRQDPAGAYAAVIPLWLASLLNRQQIFINGDGDTSRDFCYVEDVVQANLLAATSATVGASNQVYNVALGQRTTLNQLFTLLQSALRRLEPDIPEQQPVHRPFREGDIRHSLADISKAQRLLGYAPGYSIQQGLGVAMAWYRKLLRAKA